MLWSFTLFTSSADTMPSAWKQAFRHPASCHPTTLMVDHSIENCLAMLSIKLLQTNVFSIKWLCYPRRDRWQNTSTQYWWLFILCDMKWRNFMQQQFSMLWRALISAWVERGLFGRGKLVFTRTNKLATWKSHRLDTAYFPENVSSRCLLTFFSVFYCFYCFFEIRPTWFS